MSATAEKVDTDPMVRRTSAVAKAIADEEAKLQRLYDKRTGLFRQMREAGMTNRAIGAAAGLSEQAVRKALAK